MLAMAPPTPGGSQTPTIGSSPRIGRSRRDMMIAPASTSP